MAHRITRQQPVSVQKKDVARAFRRTPTPAEAAAWAVLRTRPHGWKWRWQQVIRGFVVDFYCSALVLELDGGAHESVDQRALDAERSAIFEALGLRTLRLGNDDACAEFITRALRRFTRIGRTEPLFKGRPRSTPCETALLLRLTVR